MRTKFLLIIVSFFSSLLTARSQQTDVIDALARYFSASDAQKVSAYFSSTLELNILSEENVYSKAQAEQIMRDFFSKNKPVSIKIVHRLSSNPNYKLAVFSMVTAKDKFRVSISLGSSGETFLVKEIRIEHDKQ
jgi:hypothetical protein